jgi:hypothetical protein
VRKPTAVQFLSGRPLLKTYSMPSAWAKALSDLEIKSELGRKCIVALHMLSE